MAKTKISWTEYSWNPIGLVGGGHGCTKISAGCQNCYAERLSHRFWGTPPYEGGKRDYELRRNILEQPLKRKKPTMYFVQSMSDLFHSQVSVAFQAEIFNVVADCPQHTFLVLTKRVDQVGQFNYVCGWPRLNNLWLGVSVENQEAADYRIPVLLKIPAAVRFVSLEPMLSEVDLGDYLDSGHETGGPQGWQTDPLLNWVIIGGETGPGARPMHPEWPRQVRDQCVAAGVPFFFKQWGEWAEYIQKPSWKGGNLPDGLRVGRIVQLRDDLTEDGHFRKGDIYLERVGKKQAGRLLDGRIWDETPEVRERSGDANGGE